MALSDLAERLRGRIRRDGPLTFRDWMEACLYDPGEGFYTRPRHPTGTGPESHYATAATLHPFWAEAVAREAVACWERLGSPAGFRVVEHGAGRGDVAHGALAWLDRNAPRLAAGIRWHVVERAPFASHDPRVVAGAPETFTGLVLAVEFLDALPFHWLERRGAGWMEVRVGLDGDRFVEVIADPTEEALSTAPADGFEKGQRVVAMPAARTWLAEAARRLSAGSVLVVDYGDRGDRLWTPDRADGTVRAFRGHALSADPVSEPGRQDITASVDFTLTREWAEAAGLREAAFETQESFLLRNSILDALNATDRTTREGASSYLRLRQLLLPTGLGAAFKVQRFDRVTPERGAAARTRPARMPP